MPRGSVHVGQKRRRPRCGPVDKQFKRLTTPSDEDKDDHTASPPSPPYNNNSSSPLDINTPDPRNSTQPATTPLSNSINPSIGSAGRSIPMFEAGSGVSSVHLELEDGDYVVRVKRRRITASSTNERTVEVTKELAQSAGMLFLQAEILRDMGEQLLAQYRTSLQRVMRNTASRLDFTEQ